MKKIYARKIWTSNGWFENGCVTLENGRISGIEKAEEDACKIPYLVPGMIELHVHGSLGYEVADTEPEHTAVWLRRLREHGTTGVLPSPSTAAIESMHQSVAYFDHVMQHPIEGGAKVLGVHLEGPFLNMEKKGGMDERYIIPPLIDSYNKITDGHENAVKLITVAPEMDGALELISYLHEKGVCINAGHTNATASQMRDAIDRGLNGVTHFFNAARSIHHREPGLLVAALLDEKVFCEAVCDLVHLAPEIIQLLVKVAGPDRITVITDAVELTGMPDGVYGNCKVENSSPRLLDGTLTGGRYLMDGCVRKLIEIGIDPWQVFCMASHTPARRIRRLDLGDIAKGFAADLTALDDSFEVMFTLVNGEE